MDGPDSPCTVRSVSVSIHQFVLVYILCMQRTTRFTVVFHQFSHRTLFAVVCGGAEGVSFSWNELKRDNRNADKDKGRKTGATVATDANAVTAAAAASYVHLFELSVTLSHYDFIYFYMNV